MAEENWINIRKAYTTVLNHAYLDDTEREMAHDSLIKILAAFIDLSLSTSFKPTLIKLLESVDNLSQLLFTIALLFRGGPVSISLDYNSRRPTNVETTTEQQQQQQQQFPTASTSTTNSTNESHPTNSSTTTTRIFTTNGSNPLNIMTELQSSLQRSMSANELQPLMQLMSALHRQPTTAANNNNSTNESGSGSGSGSNGN